MGLREQDSQLARGTVRGAAGMPADSRRRMREPWNAHGQNKSCCRGFPGKTGNSGVNEQRFSLTSVFLGPNARGLPHREQQPASALERKC